MKTTFFLKSILIVLVVTQFSGCGEEDEAKKLGFLSVSEMNDIHSKGWHTKSQYDSDIAAIEKAKIQSELEMKARIQEHEDQAKALGFSNGQEMEEAHTKNINNAEDWKIFMRNREEKEEKEYIKENCTKVTAWRTDAAELVGKALKVSANSVYLIRTELGTFDRCLAVVDTPKGPERCVVMRIFQDKDTKAYAIDLGDIFAVQAVCGAFAF